MNDKNKQKRNEWKIEIEKNYFKKVKEIEFEFPF